MQKQPKTDEIVFSLMPLVYLPSSPCTNARTLTLMYGVVSYCTLKRSFHTRPPRNGSTYGTILVS